MFRLRKGTTNLTIAFVVGLSCGAGLVDAGLKNQGLLALGSSPPVAAEGAVAVERSLPTRLHVGSVGIEAKFEEPLGLDTLGRMEVPDGFDTVAWYEHSPTPGERGPSVVVGHVDSESGPEVFHPLKNVKEGDEIEVERADGSIAVFIVYEVDYYSQKRFPTELVFGDVEGAELRLITCAGVYDRGVRQYSHNLVVYAKFLRLVRP